jgi:hypothetical protein
LMLAVTKSAPGAGGAGEDLLVGKRDQGRVGHNGENVVALGAQLPGDGAGEHLIQQ